MGDFGAKFTRVRPTKYRRKKPATKKRFWRHQDNIYMIQHVVGEIILQEKEKLSAEDETNEKSYDEFNEDEPYYLEKWVLMKKNDLIVHLKAKSKIYMILNTEWYEFYTRKQSK